MIGEVIFVIIGGIIGFASSCLMWKLQTRYEQKNVARALYMELSSLEKKLEAYTQVFKNPQNVARALDVEIKQPLYVEIKQPFYTEKGLFFIFRKEISSFNKELSNNLFQFYIHLLSAEEFRQVGKTDMFFKPLNEQMKDSIVKAYCLLPDLKKLLEKEC